MGGETLLVDGFSAAEKLRHESPQMFKLLSEISLGHRFLQGLGKNSSKGKIYTKANKHVIRLFNDELVQIRYVKGLEI